MKHGNVAKYIEMPIQHMDDRILEAMGRRNTYEQNIEAVKRIRGKSPDFVIRTTVIVGFPGEDRENITTLNNGLKEAQFDHLGVFEYSQEEGTAAAELEGQVDESEKEFRRDAVLNMQSPISLALNEKRVGKLLDVLIEGRDDHTGYYYGRSYAHIPEVDGKVLIKTDKPIEAGRFYKTRIIKARAYDCIGNYWMKRVQINEMERAEHIDAHKDNTDTRFCDNLFVQCTGLEHICCYNIYSGGDNGLAGRLPCEKKRPGL
jgi:ribosomal protein S12 methylthiotransferase